MRDCNFPCAFTLHGPLSPAARTPRNVVTWSGVLVQPSQQKNKTPQKGLFIFLADGEGFEPPVGLPPQRFSRPPHSTALPTILNFFLAGGLSNRRFWCCARFYRTRTALRWRFVVKTRMHSTAATNHPKLPKSPAVFQTDGFGAAHKIL